MPLDFLDFPFPVVKNLVDQMSPLDLVRVSLQSQRADNVLKACGKNDVSFFNLDWGQTRGVSDFQMLELFLLEYERRGSLPVDRFLRLRLFVSKRPCLSLLWENAFVPMFFENLDNINRFKGIRRNLRIGDNFVPVVIVKNGGKEQILTFWNNKTSGVIAAIDVFKQTSNLPIHRIRFDGNGDSIEHSNTIREIVNHINLTKTVVIKLATNARQPLLENDYKFILENIHCKTINIEYVNCFTKDYLLRKQELEYVYVKKYNHSREELQMFLKEWQAGKLPNLKELSLDTNLSILDVVEGLNRYQMRCANCIGNNYIRLKGPGNTHGRVHTAAKRNFFMEVHHQ